MKKILMLLTVVMLCSCGRNLEIQKPRVASAGSLFVHKIELTDSATVVHAAVVGSRGWFQLNGDEAGEYYLQSSDGDKKYKYQGSADFEMGKRYTLDNSGVVLMTLCFEPVGGERVVDMVVDKDESLNVRGIELKKIKLKPHTCHVRAKIEGDAKAVMITRYEDFITDTNGSLSKSWFVPIVDGGFEVDLPTSGDDFYSMVAIEQYVQSAMMVCKFFATKGDLDIVYNFDGRDNKREISGSDNILMLSIPKRVREVAIKYNDELSRLRKEGLYESDYAKELSSRADAEKDREKQMALFHELNYLPDSVRYCPEYWATYSQLGEENKRLAHQILDEAESQPTIGYLDFVSDCYNSLEFGDYYDAREKIERVAELYAEKFAHNNLAQLLAENIEAAKVKVGGDYIDFEAPDMNGKMFRFSEMIKGSRIVVLDLWASWCGPCRRAAKNNIPIYEKYKDKGMCVVSVARERNNLDDLKAAVEKDGYTWSVLVELNDRIKLWRQYGAGDSGGRIFVIDPATKKILAVAPDVEQIEALVKQYCE